MARAVAFGTTVIHIAAIIRGLEVGFSLSGNGFFD